MFSPEDRDSLRAYYLERNEVFLGEIDGAHANQVTIDLIKASGGAKRVQLVIASPGGDTDAGFRLAQFIEQELPVPVDARVWGQCSSAATYTLLTCRRRIAHPQATFVLHRQTSGIEMLYNLDFKKRMREWVKNNAKTHDQQVNFYSRKLKLSKKAVEKILLRGSGIDPEIPVKKALRLGLITGVSEL